MLPLSLCIYLGIEITNNLFLRYSNVSFGRGFVNISSLCSLVALYSNLTIFSITYSLRKWYFIGIYFVFEGIIGFLEIFTILVLPHTNDIGCFCSTLIYLYVFFIQITCVQQYATTMYISYVADREIEYFFLLNHDTRQFPKKNVPSLVHFLS